MPNTLNEFIEKKEAELAYQYPLLKDPFKTAFKSFLRSALRECAEETVKAIEWHPGEGELGKRALAWLGHNDQPHA